MSTKGPLGQATQKFREEYSQEEIQKYMPVYHGSPNNFSKKEISRYDQFAKAVQNLEKLKKQTEQEIVSNNDQIQRNNVVIKKELQKQEHYAQIKKEAEYSIDQALDKIAPKMITALNSYKAPATPSKSEKTKDKPKKGFFSRK